MMDEVLDRHRYNSQVWYNPNNKITIIVYTNCDDDQPAAEAFKQFAGVLGFTI
jgi:hypothetical protein